MRCYGLDHPTPAAALTICRTALGQLPLAAPPALDWQTVCAQRAPRIRNGVPLRAAARVYQRHPAWRCATACTGWGTRGMRPTRDTLRGEVGPGMVCLAVARWCLSTGRAMVWGAQRAQSADDCPARRRSGPVASGLVWSAAAQTP